MGSESETKVPIIDLSKENNLKPESEAWLLNCQKMRHALETFGCFLVVYDKVPLKLHNSIFEAAEQLFHLPLEAKVQSTSDKPYHGYFGQLSILPLYESMAVEKPTSLQATQSFTKLMWPSGNNNFSESVRDFSILMAELEATVTRMLFDSYGVSNLSEESIESTNYLFRFFKYRVAEKDESEVGLHCHTDLTFFSIIHQHLISGLQIQKSNGDEWIDVQPLGHSSFIVMAGDALMAWSNDQIRSCRHRVMMRVDKTRYSIGMFSFKNGGIEVPEEFVNQANPLKYKPFDHFEFLRRDKENKSPKTESRVKDYYGI